MTTPERKLTIRSAASRKIVDGSNARSFSFGAGEKTSNATLRLTHFSARSITLRCSNSDPVHAVFLFATASCAARFAAAPSSVLRPGGLLLQYARQAELRRTIRPIEGARLDGLVVSFAMSHASGRLPEFTLFHSSELPRLNLVGGGHVTLLAGRYRTLVSPARVEPTIQWMDACLHFNERLDWGKLEARLTVLYVVHGVVSIDGTECHSGQYVSMSARRARQSSLRVISTNAHIAIVACGNST